MDNLHHISLLIFALIKVVGSNSDYGHHITVTCPLPQVQFGTVHPVVVGIAGVNSNNISQRKSVQPGTVVSLTCNPGFVLASSSTSDFINTTICLINGHWSNLLGRCIAAGASDDGVNNDKNGDDDDDESGGPGCALPHPCRNGHLDTRYVRFLPVNTSSATTTMTHQQQQLTKNEATSSSSPPSPDKLLVMPGSLIRLTCDPDHTLIYGAGDTVCTRNGTWSFKLGLCLPSRIPIGFCLVPDGIENGRIVIIGNGGNNVTTRQQIIFARYSEEMSLRCDDGYEPVGQQMATCGRYGWTNELGTCQQKQPDSTSQQSAISDPQLNTVQSRFSYSECGVSDTFTSNDNDDKNYQEGVVLSKHNEFPWMVKLEIMFENDPEFRKCGGTLIHRRFVLTAAHCVTLGPIAGIIAYLGRYNMSLLSEFGQERQIINARRIHVHPDFNFNDMVYDFALIELNTPVFFRRQIRAVCLPDEEDFTCDGGEDGTLDVDALRMALPAIDSCSLFVSAGWGIIKGSSTTAESDVLKKFQMKYLPYSRCQEQYEDAKISIGDAEICAEPIANHGPDTCEGDSGGPLICYQNDRAFLVGVTSFGAASCGDTKRPGVYSRVCRVLPWIRDQVSGGTKRARENRVGAMIRAALYGGALAKAPVAPPIPVHDYFNIPQNFRL